MSTGKFGFGTENEFYPVYAEVDWYEVYSANDRPHNKPVWFETNDELGELVLQCTQENMSFYLNATDPSLDALTLLDPRDGKAIWWSREKLGEEYDTLFNAFKDEVMVVKTKYPLQSVAETILTLVTQDLEQGVPQEWK